MDKENHLECVEIRLNLTSNGGLYSKEKICTADDAVRLMAPVMSQLDREEVCVINLDGAGHPVNYNVVSIGDINQSIAVMRNILKSTILCNACNIILLHNHPSGDSTPSMEDRQVTKKLMYASAVLDVQLLDHIIVEGRSGECLSMRESEPELFDSERYVNALQNVARIDARKNAPHMRR